LEIKTKKLQVENLSYQRRLLTVGEGCEYPTLDCALEKVKPQHGGYVIKLKAGIHYTTKDCCQCVDDLTIIGDDKSPFSGMFYTHEGSPSVMNDFEFCPGVCECNEVLGEPPFQIIVSNRKITIKGSVNPSFDCILQGRRVGLVHSDGTITQGEVLKACGNTITFSADTKFVDNPTAGEGLFFFPDTIIQSGIENTHFVTSGKLEFIGVVFDGSDFTLGSAGDVLIIKNSIIEMKPNIHITGRYNLQCPNVILGNLFLAPASSGSGFFQAVVGRNANVLFDSSGWHSWKYSNFCSATNPIKLINAAEGAFKGSAFINCYEGIIAQGNAKATLYGTYFFRNTFAVLGFNRSWLSSIQSDRSPSTSYIPIFRQNLLVFLLNLHTFAFFPNATIENNDFYAIIDTVIYPTLETNAAGTDGQMYSLLIDPVNIGNAQNTASLIASVNKVLSAGIEANPLGTTNPLENIGPITALNQLRNA
jgi:hypothetical protein